jgi:glycosyltransferase involved in cell wall biosynthesis
MQKAPVNNDLPKVSIIMVTYNAAAFLQQSLDSIYRQTYPNLEIIIQDGASTDGTVAMLETNASRINYWNSAKDSGIYDAMNKAIKHITGQWVYFLGSDDVLLGGFSELAYQLEDNAAVYYGNVLMAGKKTGAITSAYSLVKKNICQQAVFYPAQVFNHDGYTFEAKYITDADHLLNMQLWNNKQYHFKYVDATIADYGTAGASSTRTDIAFENDRPQLVFKHFGLVAWARYVLRVYKTKQREKKKLHA